MWALPRDVSRDLHPTCLVFLKSQVGHGASEHIGICHEVQGAVVFNTLRTSFVTWESQVTGVSHISSWAKDVIPSEQVGAKMSHA